MQKIIIGLMIIGCPFLLAPMLCAAEPQLKWRAEIETDFHGQLAIGPDGTIYSGVSHYGLWPLWPFPGYNFTAFHPDGSPDWQTISQNPGVTVNNTAVGPDGSVYTYNRIVIKDVVTSAAFIGPDGTMEKVVDGGNLAAIASYDGTVYITTGRGLTAFRPDGSVKWEDNPFGVWFCLDPVVGKDGTIYYPGKRGFDSIWDLYAVNPDGTQKWQTELGENANFEHYYYTSGLSMGMENTIYLFRNNVLCAFGADGELKWESSVVEDATSLPVIGPDGTLYLGDKNKMLYALNEDGSLLWIFEAANDYIGSPAIDAEGTIYFISEDYHFSPLTPPNIPYLYAVNPDGTLKWRFEIEGQGSSFPIIDDDGIIYLSASQYLYAVSGAAPGPVDSPWPMFRQNPRRTANAGGLAQNRLDKDLAAYFPFNGSVTNEAAGSEPVFNYGVSFVEGKYGQAARFDGASHFHQPFSFGITNQALRGFTVSVWIKLPPEVSGRNQIFEAHVSSPAMGEVYLEGGREQIFGLSGTREMELTSSTLPVDEWVHITAVFNREYGRRYIYVNGVRDVHTDLGDVDDLSVIGGFTVGRDYETEGQFFNGEMDELRIYDRALNAGEVWALYRKAPDKNLR